MAVCILTAISTKSKKQGRPMNPRNFFVELRRREGDGGNFVRSLHDGVAALAMRGHTVTVQIILRQMHCENQDRDQTEI